MVQKSQQDPSTNIIPNKQKEEKKDQKKKTEILSKGQISTNMPVDGTILGKIDERSKKEKERRLPELLEGQGSSTLSLKDPCSSYQNVMTSCL